MKTVFVIIGLVVAAIAVGTLLRRWFPFLNAGLGLHRTPEDGWFWTVTNFKGETRRLTRP
jgi:hypothetical protein